MEVMTWNRVEGPQEKKKEKSIRAGCVIGLALSSMQVKQAN
jgi:hypothetical protein